MKTLFSISLEKFDPIAPVAVTVFRVTATFEGKAPKIELEDHVPHRLIKELYLIPHRLPWINLFDGEWLMEWNGCLSKIEAMMKERIGES